jgi:NAD(P)-dependent dehydrogenase (short-subunit alcohol dehydrogenase family)
MNEQARIVVISGAGSGIGQATAIHFARNNYCVIGCDLSQSGLDETSVKVGEGTFHGRVLNVSQEHEVRGLFEFIRSFNLPLHAVVTCAGVARTGLVHELAKDDWEFMLAVNLTGTWLMSKYSMPMFMEQNGGAFVAVGSDASVRGASGYAAYCASKHGVLGLVRCLALDYGAWGVRSNVVCPGFVQTPMMDSLFAQASDPDAEMKSYAQEVPLGRFAQPAEVAKVIYHLASEEASYTNGVVYSLDGGATAGHFG